MIEHQKFTGLFLACDAAIKRSATVVFLVLILTAFGVLPAAGGTNTLTVGATVISKNICKFKSGAATLNFGALDPGNTSDVTRTATMQFICNGSAPIASFAVATDDGLYETGPGANRMRNATVTTEYLPYSLSLAPASGTIPKGVEQTLTITGTVTSLSYREAYAGNYADTVVISLTP